MSGFNGPLRDVTMNPDVEENSHNYPYDPYASEDLVVRALDPLRTQ